MIKHGWCVSTKAFERHLTLVRLATTTKFRHLQGGHFLNGERCLAEILINTEFKSASIVELWDKCILSQVREIFVMFGKTLPAIFVTTINTVENKFDDFRKLW